MNLVRNLTVNVSREEVLVSLKENVKKHKKIVDEARKGYVKRASDLLKEKLTQLENGSLDELRFNLSPPKDHTKVYETAIKMLEMHTDDTIELDGSQVRQLIMDEWDWMENFLFANSKFSQTASLYGKEKGFF